MIVCPACHAENPDGTKICVKCGTELPKAAVGAAKAKAAAADNTKKFNTSDLRRDLLDVLWLLLILLLICAGFFGEATHWTGHLTQNDAPKMVQAPVKQVASRAAPAPHHAYHAEAPAETALAQTAPVVPVPPEVSQSAPSSPPTPQPAGEKPVVVAEAPSAPPVGEKPAVEYGNPDTFYQRGKDQYDHQHYQRSFNYLKQALEIDPTFAKAYFALGYLYTRFNMDDPAVRMYKMALRFNPDHAEATFNLGVVYYNAGNYDDALELFQKAQSLNDQNADYAFYLGTTYVEEKQPENALPYLQRAATLNPEDPNVYFNLSRVYEQLGKKPEAIDALQKAVQFSKDPDLTQKALTNIDSLQAQS